ncbi:MAG TPA: hypothetical protein VF491_21260 [Vicinamibacterales bacterium]|jgi:hypothetical protein
MSKDNKVNPGTYTQAGRLSQDDTAREYKKQHEAGSPKKTEGGQFGEKIHVTVTPKDKRPSKDQNDEE